MWPSLRQNGFKRLPIEPFRGNSFNILFQNAESTNYLSQDITIFLDGGAGNKLLKAMAYALASCKALGLLSYLVTLPLWVYIEDSSIHLLNIGTRYQEIIDFLMMASMRTDAFTCGNIHLSFSKTRSLEKNVIYSHLIQAWEHDDKVEVIF